MSLRERTSIELPRALSGSKELIAWSGVASTRTVATCAAAGSAFDSGEAALLGATITITGRTITIAFVRSSLRRRGRLRSLPSNHLNADAIVICLSLTPLQHPSCKSLSSIYHHPDDARDFKTLTNAR